MMEYDNSNKSPYHGMWIACMIMIAVPLALFALVTYVLNNFSPHTQAVNDSTAKAIGFGLGSVFHLTCIVCGAFRESFRVVIKRIAEFFENLTISVKFAFQDYWWNIKHYGVVFWGYFIIMAVCLSICIDGVRDFLTIWRR